MPGGQELAQVPAWCRVKQIGHVHEVPSSGEAASSKCGVTNITESVVGRSAVAGINEKLDTRRAARARTRGKEVLDVDLIRERSDFGPVNHGADGLSNDTSDRTRGK